MSKEQEALQALDFVQEYIKGSGYEDEWSYQILRKSLLFSILSNLSN